jgi:hypothetical protein
LAERLAGDGSRYSGRGVRRDLWDWFALEADRIDRLEKRKPGRTRSRTRIIRIADLLNLLLLQWQALSEEQRQEQVERYLAEDRAAQRPPRRSP